MIEIVNVGNRLQIKNSDNVMVTCNKDTFEVAIDDYKIDFP